MLYVIIAAAIWGTGGPAAALLYQVSGLGPLAVSFWRFVFGALVLFAAARLPGLGGPRPAWAGLLTVGAGLAVSQAAYFAAVAVGGVAVATVVTLGTTPCLVALGARFVLGERLGRRGAAGMAPALVGLALLAGGPSQVSVAGVGLALASAVAYSGITLHSRYTHADRASGPRTRPGDARGGRPPVIRADACGEGPAIASEEAPAGGSGSAAYGAAMWGFTVGGLLLLPVAALEGLAPSGSGAASAVLLGYLGVAPTALAYSLFFTGLSAVRATTASMVTLLEPAGATLIGVLLLGERLTPVAAVGAALMTCSVLLMAAAEPREGPR
ncbi:membrane protein [Sphaerisporangium melleum]|uniref:Membrane protein n=2 Tax=Sphaerisporangium melleum TaxID=321316 RepID=A0A917QYP3_9ACTN|nr:membrane protein [Sphaerisporangium melleum]